MHCPACQASSATSARYCSWCGVALNRAEWECDETARCVAARIAKAAVNILPGMISYWTPDLVCSFANRAYLEWFGRQPDECEGLHLRDLLGAEIFHENEPYISGVLRGVPQAFGRALSRPDGNTRYKWAQYIPDVAGECIRGFYILVTDVTELTVIRQTLLAHEADSRKLAEIAKRTDNAVILTDAEGRTEWVNDGFTRVTGYSLDEMLGRTPGSVLQGPETDPQVRGRMRDAVNSGQRFTAEVVNYRKSGDAFWLRIDAEPLYDDDGRLTHFMAIESDITAQRRAEVVLQLNEARWRLALGVAEMLSWDWSIGADEIVFSGDYGEFFGLPATGSILPRSRLLQPLHLDDQMLVRHAFRTSLETGQDFQIEFRGQVRRGEQTWYHSRCRILETHDGKPRRMIGVTQDITYRKQAEKTLLQMNEELERRVQQRTCELQQTENRLRERTAELQTILDSVPAMIFYQDRDFRMIRVNDAYAQAHGLPKDGIEGKTISELGSPYADQYLADDLKVISTGEPLHNVFEPFATSAGIRWLQTDKVPHRGLNGDVIGMFAVSIDITERMQAEEELRESRERLEFALRAGEIGTWDWNPQTGAVVYNDLWARMLGYNLDEVAPDVEFFKRHVHPEDISKVLDRLMRHIEGKLPEYHSEHRLRTKSGDWKWVLDRGRVMQRDDRGNALRVTGVILDISERRQTEIALRESHRYFSALFGQSVVAVAQIDSRSGRFIRINPYYCELLGYSQEEMLGLDFLRITYPDDLQEDLRKMELLRAGQLTTFQMEKRLFRKDGSLIWIHLTVMPLWAPGAEPDFHLAFVEDITDRKKFKAALLASEQRYRRLFETCGDLIMLIDASGRILDANPAALQMNGYQRTELLKMNIRELDDFASDKLVAERSQRILAGETLTFEATHRRKDGTSFPLEVVCTRLQLENATTTLAFGRDISERKKTEEQVRELRDILAHASRLGTLNQIASGLAHELNQPLTVIHIDASSALMLSRSLDVPDLTECLQRIAEQSFRAGEIVRRMNSYARRDSSQRHPEDLNRLIREVLKLLNDSLRLHAVTVELNLADNLPFVMVDGIQIQQVLVNLIRNADDAMSEIGDRQRTISIRTEVADGKIRTSVSDTGSGLDPSISARLFVPFQTTKSTGLGLGLSISRTLVEAHGGRIEALSNVDCGATFTFTIPVASGRTTE